MKNVFLILVFNIIVFTSFSQIKILINDNPINIQINDTIYIRVTDELKYTQNTTFSIKIDGIYEGQGISEFIFDKPVGTYNVVASMMYILAKNTVIVGNETTSIDDISKVDLKIYPNPTADFVTISNSKLPIKLYDLNGELVSVENDIQNTSFNEFKIDMNRFAPGVYILQSGSSRFKIVKQ